MSRKPPYDDSYDNPYTDQTVPLPRVERRDVDRAPAHDQIHQPRATPPPLQPRHTQVTSSRPWLKRLGQIIGIVLLVFVAGVLVLQQYVARQVALTDLRSNRPPANSLLSPTTILLLGVDLREEFPEEGIRSDTLMLLHTDPASGWANLLSIPRDTLATIPNYGEDKINAAFSEGYERAAELYGEDVDPIAAGAAMAADTVEQFLGLQDYSTRIDHMATINFNGFAKIVDAVGGIEVDVPHEIVDTEYPTEDFGVTTIHFPAGRQHLDGERALQYVRTRHADNDFGRNERQQQVIQAISQALNDKPLLLRPFVALRLLNATGEAVRTTMPVGRPDALLMALLLSRIDPAQIGQQQINPDNVPVNVIGTDLLWDRSAVQELVRNTLTPPGQTLEQATVQVLNGVGVEGIAGQVTAGLQQQGFTMASPGNADRIEQSQAIVYGDYPNTQARLSRVLNGIPVIERALEEAPAGVNILIILGEDYARYWNE